ncbi:MAG: DNA-binding response regulator, partial [Dethiobacteria bacterium]
MKTRILIVDQEEEFTAKLQAELEKKGSEVFVAVEKLKAQEIVRTGKPQLIVLGAIKPRGDAFK